MKTSLPATITNPIIGDQVTFLETAASTDGQYCLLKVVLAPGGGNGLHFHTDFTEEFEVLKGTLGLKSNKRTYLLKEGDTALVQRREVHHFYNYSNAEPVIFLTRIVPALDFESMLRIAYGLANEGKTNKKGMPGLLPLAVMFIKGGSYLPGIPLVVQKSFFGFLAYMAKITGHARRLERYYK